MRTLTFSVDGMRCRRCVRRATAAVRDVEGVHAVTASAESGLLTVRGTMSDQEILVALTNSTFQPHLIADKFGPTY